MTWIKQFLAVIVAVLLSITSLTSPARAAEPMPQTARQALLEMFFSKTPGTFEKHLPQATRAVLRKAGTTPAASMLSGISAMTTQLTARGQQLQTFEAGPVLMSVEDPQLHTKFEINVERDDLRAGEDEIELSFHGYKDGETQIAGTKVRFTVTMKQEAGSWRLNEVMVAVGVSLTDPAFLKAMTTSIEAASTASTQMGSARLSAVAPSTMAATNAGNEASAVSGIRTLNTAEVTYAAAFPTRGFTCALQDMGGMGAGGGPSEHQAMLIDPRLSSGRKNGYVFRLGGCDGNPATRYTVSAMPADAGSGTRSFCSDESAVIRYSEDGKAESCLSAGKPLQ